MTLPGLPRGMTCRVDCGACRACCRRMVIILDETAGDDVSETRGDWEWRDYGELRVRQLKVKRNGDCVNLTKKGCAVYATRPAVCKAFDCAAFVLSRPSLGACGDDPVIAEGKRRLALTYPSLSANVGKADISREVGKWLKR